MHSLPHRVNSRQKSAEILPRLPTRTIPALDRSLPKSFPFLPTCMHEASYGQHGFHLKIGLRLRLVAKSRAAASTLTGRVMSAALACRFCLLFGAPR